MESIARSALAATLLGAAVGPGVVLLALRKGLRETHVLPSLFMVVFLAVLGASALNPSVNLAVAASAGLMLALVVGGSADWFLFLARTYPATPHLFPAVFMTVLLLVLGVGGCDVLTSPGWYRSTARLGLRLGTSPDSRPVPDPQLIKTECEVIRSDDILRPVIEGLDLNKQWGKRYHEGYPLKTSETRVFLKRRIDVRSIPDTWFIEIRAHSEQAGEAALLANNLAETYRDHLLKSAQGPTAIQAEFLDHAVPATSALAQYKWVPLIGYALLGLCLAFAAGGGSLRVASLIAALKAKAQGTKAQDP